tara:strand:- start:399 stop:545 length:147 start_codon:yes stop_codon:yes gene_type:complete
MTSVAAVANDVLVGLEDAVYDGALEEVERLWGRRAKRPRAVGSMRWRR